MLYACLIPVAFFAGLLLGKWLEGNNWRLSGQSHHHSHPWAGKWYRIEEEPER